jgi:hypothetical protein
MVNGDSAYRVSADYRDLRPVDPWPRPVCRIELRPKGISPSKSAADRAGPTMPVPASGHDGVEAPTRLSWAAVGSLGDLLAVQVSDIFDGELFARPPRCWSWRSEFVDSMRGVPDAPPVVFELNFLLRRRITPAVVFWTG